ncbi:MAG: RNase J family beta-CASP ribonuclease [Clostridia bacterium]|nr:RNase J family beta-CASP ribonuclease [Clostridia bacterium]
MLPVQEKKSAKKNGLKGKQGAKNQTDKTAEKPPVSKRADKTISGVETPKKRISAPRNSKKETKGQTVQTLKAVKPVNAKKTSKKHAQKPVKIIFLGGVGEIGKNMTAFEYGNDIIILDAGLTFPNSEDMPGVDSVVPDVTYLAQNKDKIRGVLLTHGHEDHIGGVPYLMKELNPSTPIFGTKLTLMLTDNKLQEHRIQDTAQRVVKAGDKVKLGAFEVEFINVNHSISGACALAIRTPNGLIYHSGDFKIDLTPVAGEPIDFKRISELGKEGVLLYMSESTNIERPGYTMSETVVGTTLDHLFSENMHRRLIIATFASNVHRLQQIIDLAVKYRRKVALSGRSMFKVVDAAVKIGELRIPEGVLVDIEKTKNLFDGELLIVSTGSQGEPMSALTRMSMGEFNKVTIGENDTVIISANPIPGNEKMIYRVINNLYKRGARVVYESLEKIHVSGHACQEEHKILFSLLNPKFFIPVHGEYRHLKRHAQLAEALGVPERNILITDIGNCVELTENEMKFGENVQAGTLLIDGVGVEDYGDSEVMKDRLKMSADGVFTIAIAVTGNYVINDPAIEAHGCTFTDDTSEGDMRAVVCRAVDNYDYANGNKTELALAIKKSVKSYFYKKTKKAPLIVVSILDV